MKTVKIDNEEYEYITSHAKYGESFAQVLKRLLGGMKKK